MKNFIAVMGIILLGIVICTSCKPRQKCPAYGNYTYYEIVDPADKKL